MLASSLRSTFSPRRLLVLWVVLWLEAFGIVLGVGVLAEEAGDAFVVSIFTYPGFSHCVVQISLGSKRFKNASRVIHAVTPVVSGLVKISCPKGVEFSIGRQTHKKWENESFGSANLKAQEVL